MPKHPYTLTGVTGRDETVTETIKAYSKDQAKYLFRKQRGFQTRVIKIKEVENANTKNN